LQKLLDFELKACDGTYPHRRQTATPVALGAAAGVL
jgi:hypothetical protein|tara:strand:- start:2033 stop:2140 length:108 start_codon:yes stop_codon:yes gene_type:complete